MKPHFSTALEKANKGYTAYYAGSGVLPYLRRFFRFPVKYLQRAASLAGILPKKTIVRAKTFWGTDIFVLLSDKNAGSLHYFGFLPKREYRLTKFLINHLKEDDVFYDIGANYGFYGLLATILVPRGEVHLFEPHPLLFECITRTFRGKKEALLSNVALSDGQGTVSFFDGYQGGHSGGSTIRKEIASRDPKKYRELKVAATTLDTYAKRHSPPTVMKLDVEGAEYQVLRGGWRLLRKYRPVLLMECWGQDRWERYSEKVIKLITEKGYKPYTLDDEGRTHRAEFDSLREWVDRHSYDNLVFLPI